MDLLLVLQPNGTGHDDLVLRFAGELYRADSYYLALDPQLDPDREDEVKVRAVLRRLLERWRDAVRALAPGDATYIPYDFSDQCTAWLRLQRQSREETLRIDRGWSSVEGWALCPSDSATRTAPSGFNRDGPSVCAPIEEVLDAIEQSLDANSLDEQHPDNPGRSRANSLSVYVLEGCRFATLEEFAAHFSDVVLDGHIWSGNLDALNDILRGGFGTPGNGFILVWKDHQLSRERLGYAETARRLERILTTCHPENRDRIASELDEARARRGSTLFELLVEIITDHGPGGDQAEDGIELRLE